MGPVHPPETLLDALSTVFAQWGIEPRALAVGFARAAPAVTLVPALGLGAVPPQTRLALGLGLGACIAPALGGPAADGPLLLALARAVWHGLPVAVMASLVMYVAAMAGGVIDDLRGARDTVSLPALPEPMPPTAVLFTLLSVIAFLETGGAARVAKVLSVVTLPPHLGWAGVAQTLAGSVELAFALSAPLFVATLLLETASALIARAATPAFIGPLLSPLKSLALLGVLALMLDRIAELLVILSRRTL